MRRTLLLLPSILVVTLLAGCGNKGPLVLPPPRPAPAASAPTPAPAPATASSATPVSGQR
ncbi:MAG TPA: lipoprotein [Rhodanobacter sp.]|nr:lipoprotein [Rhodanobacter sp.]